ncbi:MAG: diphthine--ammonia ligase [Candidatus Bathyarchaeia archaeon]
MKVAASWSGGKDSAFACFKAKQQGFSVIALLTFMETDARSDFHWLPQDLLDAQAQSAGIPLVRWKTRGEHYEEDFKDALRSLKATGAEGLVTGDIYDVAMHEKGWLERVCGEVGFKPVKPLWQQDTRKLLREFVDEGFRATIVKLNTEVMGKEWLGRQLNDKFYSDIVKLGNVDPCGENGEYHTCITEGPLFKQNLKILEAEKRFFNEGFGFLDIKRFELRQKHR